VYLKMTLLSRSQYALRTSCGRFNSFKVSLSLGENAELVPKMEVALHSCLATLLISSLKRPAKIGPYIFLYHWGFFPCLPPTEPCALRSIQPLKVSIRDFSWGKGGRCIWLATYHPCSAKRQENPRP